MVNEDEGGKGNASACGGDSDLDWVWVKCDDWFEWTKTK